MNIISTERTIQCAEIRSYIKGRTKLEIARISVFQEACTLYGSNKRAYTAVTRWLRKCQTFDKR